MSRQAFLYLLGFQIDTQTHFKGAGKVFVLPSKKEAEK